jgi:NADH-quinone oxidoreductase subunit A
MEFAAVLVFMLLGTAFVLGGLIAGWFIRLSLPSREKSAVYECGEPTIGSAWIRYNSRFYTVALVYLLFDVEVVVLVPVALVLRSLALEEAVWAPLVGLLAFLALLVLGLVYEWFYGNLDWIGEPLQDQEDSTVAAEGNPHVQ